MADFIRNGFLLGLGAALAGKEKLQQKLNELVEKNELSKDQARQLMDSFIEKGQNQTDVWDEERREQMKKLGEELSLATKDDIAALKERISVLERKLKDPQE
ncbi:phasin family protein [Virgibacillus halophilus]|uniref:Polyhydroxyalkanoate synthesis regulator phasin n=1 Tax=Tigheibacillus halophilus TaxID=361280 RepID=A0ABU5C4N3_9BACI|nr:hypothetical protein [Virgibacillus halophilus]